MATGAIPVSQYNSKSRWAIRRVRIMATGAIPESRDHSKKIFIT
jgi:hypothetical protein